MKKTRGSVLVFTLWMVVGLAAAALLFGHSAMLNYRSENNRIAALQAELAAESALAYVLEIIAATDAGQVPDPATYTAEELMIGGCRVWLLARPVESSAAAPAFGLMDEGAKLNLNTAELEMILALQGMTEELAGAIVDWRDVDDEISPSGAESETYLAMEPPSMAKNAPFETVGELGMLNGATPALLTGRDLNRNGFVEAWELNLSRDTQERFAELPDIGFLERFTAFTQESNTTENGDARTPLNSTEAINALNELLGSERGAAVAVAATLGITQFRSVLEFCIRGGLTPTEAEQVFDRFTVDEATTRQGLVNVQTASREVLATLPGLGDDLAAQLVAQRSAEAESTQLWIVGAIGEEAALAIAPYITTRSYQFTADIVAVAPGARAFRRLSFIIDTTSGTPVVISRRDLTHVGWPLGDELREALLNQPWETML